MRRLSIWSICFMCFALVAADAQTKELVNVDKSGLALQGYDPVSFVADGRAEKGSADITAAHRGATYRFVTDAHRKAFAQDPERYAPAYGGFCAYAVSRGHTAKVEIDTWQIIAGRLFLNYDQSVRKLFDAERDVNVKKADGNWPGLVESQGK